VCLAGRWLARCAYRCCSWRWSSKAGRHCGSFIAGADLLKKSVRSRHWAVSCPTSISRSPRGLWRREGSAAANSRRWCANWRSVQLLKKTAAHDWASHAADAWRYLSMAWRQMVVVKEPPPKPLYTPTNELTIGDYTKYGKMSNEKSELV
jgi:hypothetical protein